VFTTECRVPSVRRLQLCTIPGNYLLYDSSVGLKVLLSRICYFLVRHDKQISQRGSTRSSATAERQRVSCTRLSRLAHWSCTSL